MLYKGLCWYRPLLVASGTSLILAGYCYNLVSEPSLGQLSKYTLPELNLLLVGKQCWYSLLYCIGYQSYLERYTTSTGIGAQSMEARCSWVFDRQSQTIPQ